MVAVSAGFSAGTMTPIDDDVVKDAGREVCMTDQVELGALVAPSPPLSILPTPLPIATILKITKIWRRTVKKLQGNGGKKGKRGGKRGRGWETRALPKPAPRDGRRSVQTGARPCLGVRTCA